MKFEIEVPVWAIDDLRHFLYNTGGTEELLSLTETIKELFLIEDRHGEIKDRRDDVIVREVI